MSKKDKDYSGRQVQLGDEVRCKVTGIQGIAVARITHLTKCTQIHIQPRVDKDGKHVDGYYIDEPMMEVVTPGKIEVPAPTLGEKAGGPSKRVATERARR